MKKISSSVLALNVNKKKQSQVNFLKRKKMNIFVAVDSLEHHALLCYMEGGSVPHHLKVAMYTKAKCPKVAPASLPPL
jgi:hypothetical protein